MIPVLVPTLSKTFNFFLLVTLFSFLILTGCEKKDTGDQQPGQTIDTSTAINTPDTISTVDTTKQVDLKGRFSGTFDQRATTLNIKDQDGNKFKGSITINYREVINQQVEGEFNPKTMTFTMRDLLHSRYAGTYSGKFNENFSSMSGTFTMRADDKKFSFNLKKK